MIKTTIESVYKDDTGKVFVSVRHEDGTGTVKQETIPMRQGANQQELALAVSGRAKEFGRRDHWFDELKLLVGTVLENDDNA